MQDAKKCAWKNV